MRIPKPQYGSRRVKRVFLLFPKTMGVHGSERVERRWLEWSNLEQIRGTSVWFDWEWITDEEYDHLKHWEWYRRDNDISWGKVVEGRIREN